VNISGRNGVTQRQLREYTGSVFTTYTFDSGPRWLKDLSVGGGVRYRGKPVVGYINGSAPVYGDSDVKVDLLLKKQLRLMNRRVRVQANFDNVLNENKPIVADADLSGVYRYLYPTPFRWSLSATLDF
jgi:outer membrane receptor for monomeric catechols